MFCHGESRCKCGPSETVVGGVGSCRGGYDAHCLVANAGRTAVAETKWN